jgi:hypothetical protein
VLKLPEVPISPKRPSNSSFSLQITEGAPYRQPNIAEFANIEQNLRNCMILAEKLSVPISTNYVGVLGFYHEFLPVHNK